MYVSGNCKALSVDHQCPTGWKINDTQLARIMLEHATMKTCDLFLYRPFTPSGPLVAHRQWTLSQ